MATSVTVDGSTSPATTRTSAAVASTTGTRPDDEMPRCGSSMSCAVATGCHALHAPGPPAAGERQRSSMVAVSSPCHRTPRCDDGHGSATASPDAATGNERMRTDGTDHDHDAFTGNSVAAATNTTTKRTRRRGVIAKRYRLARPDRRYSCAGRMSMARDMPTIGLFSLMSPVDPRNGAAPNENTPPSDAMSQ